MKDASDERVDYGAIDAVDLALVERARALIDAAKNIVVLTGAGISTDSGIPDFRGPNGLWTRNPEAEKASNIDHYVNDPEVRKANWRLRAEGALWANVEPNLGHHALVTLAERGILHTLITQNVDELHQRAGLDPDKVVEIHGTTRKVACLECEYRDNMEEALDRVRAGEPDPACPRCGGILKSATVSFGQSLVFDDLQRAEFAAHECDLMLAVGSTLSVYPIANVVPVAAGHGAPVIIVNGEATQFDPLAEVVLHASISEVLARLCRYSG
ncbi:MAG: NAD-dependent deacetylase [Acidimicrobiales bacterium]